MRQVDEVAARREAEHLVLEHLQLGILEEFLGARRLLQDFQQFPQPAVLRPLGAAGPLLVVPVGGDTALGHLVHFVGPDLDLDALALGAEDAGMDRTVAVRLRRADVVLEAPRHHRIGAVDDAENLVDLLDGADHHPEGHDVGQLLEVDAVALHLAPDRIRLLLAPRDHRLDPVFVISRFELADDAGNALAGVLAQEIETGEDRVAGVGVDSANARSSSSFLISCMPMRSASGA